MTEEDGGRKVIREGGVDRSETGSPGYFRTNEFMNSQGLWLPAKDHVSQQTFRLEAGRVSNDSPQLRSYLQ